MEKTIRITIKKNLLPLFFPLFQKGIIIKSLMGDNIKNFLARHLEVSPEYMESRIQTIFLNGKAVDDLETAVIREGSTLALSAAMPGLAGATLRRSGTLASFRQAITFTAENGQIPVKEGLVTLKLFNLLVSELGPRLLAKGVWIKEEEITPLLETLKDDLSEGGRKTNEVMEGETSGTGKDDLIFLSVSVE
jgi:hypothetical protein